MEIALIIIAVVSLIGIIIGVTIWQERRRRDALASVAIELGLEFHPEGSEALAQELSAFALFNNGRSRKQSKLIQGESDEVQISIFDYRYTTGSGKHSKTHHQSVAALCSEKLQMPEFTLRPENMLDKLGGLLGMSDINFDSHPKFSSMFVLKGNNVPAIRKFFKPAVLSFFENHKGISVEAIKGKLVFYRPHRRVAPQDLKKLLQDAYEVYGVMIDSQEA